MNLYLARSPARVAGAVVHREPRVGTTCAAAWDLSRTFRLYPEGGEKSPLSKSWLFDRSALKHLLRLIVDVQLSGSCASS